MNQLLILYYLLCFYLNPIKTHDRLEKVRRKRLEKLQRFLIKHSPYYAEKITQYGNIAQLPIIQKSDHFIHFDRINTQGITYEQAMRVALTAEHSRNFSPMIGSIAVGLSSGTTGNRGLFLTSNIERCRWVAAMIHRVIGWEWHRRKIAFFLRANNRLYEASQSRLIQFSFFDLSRPFETLMLELEKTQPDILIAQPSVLYEIASRIEKKRLHIEPKKVISVAEVLEPDVKAYLMRIYGQMIHQVYQCTEGFLAHTCSEGTLHLNDDLLLFESVPLDTEGRRFHPILTDLNRHTQPIVRYELNDILCWSEVPCACGSPMRAIAHIEGRQDDTLVFETLQSKQVMVFGDIIRRIFMECDQENIVVQYQIQQLDLSRWAIHMLVDDAFHRGTIQHNVTLRIAQFCEEHQLKQPIIVFKNEVHFNPMTKFRRIIRHQFPLSNQIHYL